MLKEALTAALEERIRSHATEKSAQKLRRTTDTTLRPEAADTGDFLTEMLVQPWSGEEARAELDRTLAELRELTAENRWNDIITLFHPLEEKAPLLVDQGLDLDVALKVAFALGRAGRQQEAVETLTQLAARYPEHALIHYNIGYTALDALYVAKTSRSPMTAKERQQLVAMAHQHFTKAQNLRPDSVTFFYREGILYKEIEQKSKKAIPLFEQAIANWLRRDADQQRKGHQQRPKYIRSLYHLASCFLDSGQPKRSLKLLERLIEEDGTTDVMAPVFKHFAMGKVLHALGRFQEALQHLDTAAYRAASHQPLDFVFELAARCALRLEDTDRAAGYINKIPASNRRPYVSWTEADVLCAQHKMPKALEVLKKANSKDRRSRHKGLLRMARIHLRLGQWLEARECCREANMFFLHTYGNPCLEAKFWEAAACLRLKKYDEGLELLKDLEEDQFTYPNLARLKQALRQGSATDSTKDSRSTQ